MDNGQKLEQSTIFAIVRDKGMCGKIGTNDDGTESACLLDIDHQEPCGWEHKHLLALEYTDQDLVASCATCGERLASRPRNPLDGS